MAPDRGLDSLHGEGAPPGSRWDDADDDDSADMPLSLQEDESAALLSQEGTAAVVVAAAHSLTIRGVLAGLVVGLVICFSNMYFGLQTGWVSSMTMPASLLGFGIFKLLSRHLSFPFSPAENVLVQTVAGSMAVMPLGCGFVGVVPAMEYLLTPGEGGPLKLKLGQLVIWSLGLCYFGVVFAVPLRRQVIIRERLRFPSGFSTAVLIGVLHGHPVSPVEHIGKQVLSETLPEQRQVQLEPSPADLADSRDETKRTLEWKSNVGRLLLCFIVSGLLTLTTYFIPTLRNLPIFGSVAAEAWLWTLNPSLAYVGQGIIMGPTTTLHMLLGAIVGWGILSPLAKYKGWAPGRIDDWNHGSQGWIVWVSLAIMLADAVVSLAYIAYRSLVRHLLPVLPAVVPEKLWQKLSSTIPNARPDSSGLEGSSHASGLRRSSSSHSLVKRSTTGSGGSGSASRYKGEEVEEVDAPADQLIGNRTVVVGLVLSVVFCVLCTHLVFGHLVPLFANVAAVFLALVLSIMGVRALGETDLNPVSGISKLAQLFFALITPQHSKSSVLINLVAGAVSEAGALQAGDLMQDLKTGHLIGAAPKAQFWGQVIGCTVGAVASALIYQLYTAVYDVPGKLFQIPTGYVWIFTARLVTGQGLPPMAETWAIGAAALFALFTMLRIWQAGRPWHPYIPGGIAVAVGMYNVPSFTLARAIGGLVGWYWRSRLRWEETPLIVLASGFILGEGSMSIVNLLLQTFGVPHL